MFFRSDLAIEKLEADADLPQGVVCETEQKGNINVTRLTVSDLRSAEKIEAKIGTYITVEVPDFSDYVDDDNEIAPIIAEEIRRILNADGLVLVAGLGNSEITPDAIGPKTAQKVIATRHLVGEMARVSGLEGLQPVAVTIPNVLGKTGIESVEMLEGIVKQIKPCAVIVIDALMARSLSRLGNTVQLSDTGISPGAGVGNFRPAVNKEKLGIPVISIGIPTVVDGRTLVNDLIGDGHICDREETFDIMVTPREVDLLIQRAARMTALAINCALQPMLTVTDILMLQA